MAASTASKNRTRGLPTPPGKIDGTDLDIVELSSSDELEPDLIEIFRLDGKPYYVDRNQSAQVVLEYLHLTNTKGQEAAVGYMFETMLGAETFAALRGHRNITVVQLGKVLVALQAVLLGDQGAFPKALQSAIPK